MKKLLTLTMMLFAFASFSNAQNCVYPGTGTCAAPAIIQSGTDAQSGNFFFEVSYQPGDFFVVQTASDSNFTSNLMTGCCQSNFNNDGTIHLNVMPGYVFGNVASGYYARVAKYCHSISQWCYTTDGDYGAFTHAYVVQLGNTGSTGTGNGNRNGGNGNGNGHGHH